MKNLEYYLNLCEFLGKEMTDQQAEKLLVEIQENLSIADIQKLSNSFAVINTPLYFELSQYDAEMGGLGRY